MTTQAQEAGEIKGTYVPCHCLVKRVPGTRALENTLRLLMPFIVGASDGGWLG